jgi:hypothetical protein
MIRLLLTFIISMALCLGAYASPFLISDPNDGVIAYEIGFVDDENATFLSPASPDGSLRWDIAEWIGAVPGWHLGSVRACEEYTVEDLQTNAISSVTSCSEPAQFRLRLPKHEWNQNFKIQE